MAATATQAPEKVNGTAATPSAAPSSAPLDPLDADAGIGTDAPISAEEAAAMRGETPENPDESVQPGGESADDAGAEPNGEESAESGAEPGEESNEADPEAERKALWDDAFRMAKGDPVRAAEIYKLSLGDEGARGTAAPAEADPKAIESSIAREVESDVAQFYAERGTEEKPGDERKALTGLLTRQRVALVQGVSALLDQFEGRLSTKTKTAEAMGQLKKEYPDWHKNRGAFERFVAERPSRRSLDPVDAYELFLAKQAKRGVPAGAKKAEAVRAAADKKLNGTARQSVGGGRPSGGPTEKPHVSTEQREIRVLRGLPRVPRLP